jgi:hypothetical protein
LLPCRLGSGKPQNLILDDGKDSDEDETFVVEDAQPQLEEPIEQVGMVAVIMITLHHQYRLYTKGC